MLPSYMWLWGARSKEFDGGGWCVEKIGEESKRHVAGREFGESEEWGEGLGAEVIVSWLGIWESDI